MIKDSAGKQPATPAEYGQPVRSKDRDGAYRQRCASIGGVVGGKGGDESHPGGHGAVRDPKGLGSSA